MVRLAPWTAPLSPGAYDWAFSEHVFPTRGMAVPRVEGRKLAVENGPIHARTTANYPPPRW